jgi:hypothetical protein
MGLALSDVVQASVSASSASPTVPGFGKTLLMVNKVPVSFPATPQTYTSLAGLITAGFLTTDDAYLAASACFSANPAPPAIMICQRVNKTSQVIKLKCLTAVQGSVYTITITTPLGVSTTITRTVPGSSTTTAEATAIAALIAAVTGFAGTTAAVDTITVTSPTAGTLNGYSNWTSNFYLTDTTTDPGLAADLATAIAGDNTWYGLEIDSHSKAEILVAAAFAEANKKLFVTQSSESTVPDNAVTTDVASVVQSSAYFRTAILYTGNNTKNFAALEWQSGRFAGSPTPGNDTWMYNTLPGILVDNLTETQNATLGNKFATGYASMQGVNITVSGGIANTNSAGRSGSGEFLDTRRFLDWLLSQIQLGIYSALLGPGKTPFTDKGLQSLATVVLGALQRGEQAQGLVVGSSQVATTLASNVSSADRQNRIFRGLTWSAQLAGAVHLVVSSGTVTS